MKAHFAHSILFKIIVILLVFSTKLHAQSRERLSLDKGWLFHQGDIPFPIIKGHDNTYSTAKAGVATGAAAVDYNDKQWQQVNLPHDWAIFSEVDSTENVSQGYRKRGYGWYRRTFKLDSSDRGKNIEIQLDGIATNSTIWVNGTVVHHNWCGYTSSYIDITTLARYGNQPNIIAIKVDATTHEGWWYEGAGIYRHTWLVKRSPVFIATDGVYAHPIKKSINSWLVPAEVTVQNAGKRKEEVDVLVELFDKSGVKVADGKNLISVAPFDKIPVKVDLTVSNPVLWDINHPVLYTVKSTLIIKSQSVDQVTTHCGFRTIAFTKDSGFYLNGRNLKIQGVCNHQDHAGVGVAVPDALWEFRVRKLKELGANAYRCSHNPPATEFLNVCDSLGLLVMDENRNFNTSPEYIGQLEWMVRRDRNHPSIILWSVFNEEPMQGTESGYEMVRYMNAKVKALDTTRPVTASMNGGLFEPYNVSNAVDVVGFNYQHWGYDQFHKENPNKKMTSSEDVSAFQVRGEYTTDYSKNIVDAYDSKAADWGLTHRKGWKEIATRPYLAGGFVWTGFDYHGEPTPFKWPSTGSFFGIMDQCGFPKMAYWLHQAQWRKDINVLQIVPHWNWPTDSIGKNIKVMVLSNADSVTILLNGKLVGGQKVDQYEMNTFNIPYKPGKLEAIGYKNKKQISQFKTETTGKAVALQLIAYKNSIENNGQDAVPVTVQAIDEKGRPVPTANLNVQFEISDHANIIGVGNGNPNSHESDKANHRNLFNGLAQVIIQSKEGKTGYIRLVAKADNLQSAIVEIKLIEVPVIPFMPAVK